MTKLFVTLVLGTLACSHGLKSKKTEVEDPNVTVVLYNCQSAREYITAHRYLLANQALQINSVDARKVALEVSAGCTGAARRFIRVSNMLMQAGLDTASALIHGKKLALSTDDEARTFLLVFKRAFLKEYLDLDIKTAIQLAKRMSVQYDGNAKTAGEDYEKVLDFCLDKQSLDLPRPKCGELAARVAKYGEGIDKGVGDDFVKMFHFLTSAEGAQLATHDALELADQLASVSPYAIANFKRAYEYAISQEGLSLGRVEAIQLAKTIAGHTIMEL